MKPLFQIKRLEAARLALKLTNHNNNQHFYSCKLVESYARLIG